MRHSITALAIFSLISISACDKNSEIQSAATAEPDAPVEQSAAAVASRADGDRVPIDPVTGFRMSGDWELVRAHCTGCHSSKLVTQQRGTAQQWLGMIRWMQKKQNLWQFDPGTENRIIAYLSENYPPDEARRRAAIPPELMPPNPYSNATLD